MKLGVLALQGDFEEHRLCFEELGVEVIEIRLPSQLQGLDGLVIPGGESTTIGKLATDFNLIDPIRSFGKSFPIWGTCGGLVFLAKDVGTNQPTLGLVDMVVERNAFGRQVESFEEDLTIKGLTGGAFRGIFIRAPRVVRVGPGVNVLCELGDGSKVAIRQGKLLATSFHPELTTDRRIHQYFLDIISETN